MEKAISSSESESDSNDFAPSISVPGPVKIPSIKPPQPIEILDTKNQSNNSYKFKKNESKYLINFFD